MNNIIIKIRKDLKPEKGYILLRKDSLAINSIPPCGKENLFFKNFEKLWILL